ncbi:MAG TPA: hypothetical protein VGI40_16740 [Pirellulaceae bacterium]|jgi:hypothetical protein
MRYRLRTLLIVLAVGPAVLAVAWFYPEIAIPMMIGWPLLYGLVLFMDWFVTTSNNRQ